MALLERMLTPNAFLVAIVAVVLSKLWGGNTKSIYDNTMRSQSAVLVTGVSRGIGFMIARNLVFWGYTVYGTVRTQTKYDELVASQKLADEQRAVNRQKRQQDPHRNPNQNEPGRIIPILLDVTDDVAISKAVTTVQESCTKHNVSLVAIVNNAGINPEADAIVKSMMASQEQQQQQLKDKEEEDEKDETNTAESTSPPASSPPSSLPNVLCDSTTALHVLNVNVVGTMRITKAFLPLLDKQRGRIILLGSYFGTIAGALGLAHCAYETSKFAIEAIADNLRRGLKNDDDGNTIQVALIKPGNIITDMNPVGGESPTTDVSKEVVFAIEARNAQTRYYPGMVKGLPCKWVCDFFSLLPTVFTDTQL